jgi:predicted nuclease of predicted toxin-antitoxin system
MRLLADESFPRPTVEALRREGHDVVWARTDCPAAKDTALLDRAKSDGSIVLTLDKDFWQLALQRKIPLLRGGVILFQLHPAVLASLTPLVRRALGERQDWNGHVSLVTNNDIQMIPARRPRRR